VSAIYNSGLCYQWASLRTLPTIMVVSAKGNGRAEPWQEKVSEFIVIFFKRLIPGCMQRHNEKVLPVEPTLLYGSASDPRVRRRGRC
jgi:hypothetical protein